MVASRLRKGAASTDGAIRLAFIHDFSQHVDVAACGAHRKAVETIGEVLAGTGKPFVITGATLPLSVTPSRIATEVCVSIMRLPPTVHGDVTTAS